MPYSEIMLAPVPVPPTRVSKRLTVDQLADLFHTTHKIKTQQVTRNRGQRCGDIELAGDLVIVGGPVHLVLDLRIPHHRWGSSSDPNINGHFHYPNDIDRSLNESTTDKIRKYRANYNNNPPNSVSCQSMTTIASRSWRLHSELVCLLFLQDHRETDRFFASSGVHLAQHDRDQFHFLLTAFSPQVGNILAKAARYGLF
jgi:hypothetical protein